MKNGAIDKPIARNIKMIDTVVNGVLSTRNMRVANEELEFLYMDLVQINDLENPDNLRTSIFFRRKEDDRLIEIRIYSHEVSLVVAHEEPVWDLIEHGCAEAGAAYDDGS